MSGTLRFFVIPVPRSALRIPRSRYELPDSFLHFARGLVGEGHAQDVTGRNSTLNHVGNDSTRRRDRVEPQGINGSTGFSSVNYFPLEHDITVIFQITARFGMHCAQM
jgi:hypothetical protein